MLSRIYPIGIPVLHCVRALNDSVLPCYVNVANKNNGLSFYEFIIVLGIPFSLHL